MGCGNYVHVPNAARFFDNTWNNAASSASCRLERDLKTFTAFEAYERSAFAPCPVKSFGLVQADYNHHSCRLVTGYEVIQRNMEALGVKPLR